MSRVCVALSWLLIVPYAYIAFFLGWWVGDSAKTPPAAAVLFLSYLAVYPVAVLVCSLFARELRASGREGQALTVSLVPYGVLAVVWAAFAAFVDALCRMFG